MFLQDLSWILNGSNLKQDVGRDFAIRILASGPEQSMKSIIDGQSITKIFEIIDYHRLSISLDNRWESIN